MIGAILSMHYVGKKKWIQSIVFWIVYFILMMIVTAVLSSLGLVIGVAGIIVSAVVFISLAHYWPEYKFDWFRGLKVYAVALVIDIILVLLIVGAIVATVGWDILAGTSQFLV